MISNLKSALLEVYSEKRYYAITVISGLLIYSANALFHNYKLVFSKNVSWPIVFSLIKGFHHTMAVYSIFYLVMISLLTGILLSMSYYLIKRQVSSSAYAGGVGIIMSILAPGCSSCALGVLGLLGLGGFLTILPFKGIELGVIGIIAIIISIFIISRKVMAQTCSVR